MLKAIQAGEILKKGGVGVLLTDTIYGLVAPALNKKSVERVYELKKRTPDKPCIVLISDIKDLEKFDIEISPVEKKFLNKFWPGEISIIFELNKKKYFYLHRGTNSLAFRVPKVLKLRKLVSSSGPLIAPSANPEGQLPAKSIRLATKYFGSSIDFYLEGGVTTTTKPSTLIKINEMSTEIIVLRSGAISDLSIAKKIFKSWKVLSHK
jgi:L-threonylcarbamoyladenylate synthase